jgi:hypothetical protein
MRESVTHYTKEQFMEKPERFLHDVGTVVLGVTFENESSTRTWKTLAFWEVLLMNQHGCVVVGDYSLDPDWLLTTRAVGPAGDGVYLVPWEAIDWLGSGEMAEQVAMCQDADQRMLDNAR